MFSVGQSSLLKGLLLIGMLGALTLPAVALPDSSQLPAGQPASAGYSASELDLLFKPVALYPDPLLAQLLPAAAFPAQIEAASQWLKANPQGNVDSQPWDAAVRALAHYPEVIDQLAQDLAWTEAMGHAAATQMSDVTGSLQRLRSQAYAAGNLQSNEQQTVTNDENYLTIQPTSPQVIYVPVYNPSLVYSPCPLGWDGSLISFGLGYACGSWLSYGFDWYGSSCFRYPRGFYYGSYCGPRYNNVSYIHNTYNVGNCNSWRPGYGQSYSNYNQCYRPGNSWARLPGCGSSTGWNQNNFYRPGGNWSSHVSSGWNQPGSHAPSNWSNSSGGNWNGQARGSNPSSGGWSRQGSYQPGGNWSSPGNSRSSSGWNQSGSNSWTGSRAQKPGGWSGNTGSTWSQNSSGWSGGGRHSSGLSFPSTGGGNWSGNTGSNSSGWSGGGRHTSGLSFPSTGGGNWSGNTGSNSSGWSGGGRHSSGLSFPSTGGGNWSGNTGSNSSSWSGGGRHSSGMSFPSAGGFSSQRSSGGGNWSGNTGGGFSSQHSNGGGNWSGNSGQRSSGWSGGGRQSSPSGGGFSSHSNGGGGNWSGGGGRGRHR